MYWLMPRFRCNCYVCCKSMNMMRELIVEIRWFIYVVPSSKWMCVPNGSFLATVGAIIEVTREKKINSERTIIEMYWLMPRFKCSWYVC